MCLFWPDALDPRYDTRSRHEGHHILLSTDGAKLATWEVSKDAGAVFAHYGRFVRPGDHQIAMECGDSTLRASAFVSQKNRRYVAVIVNNSKDKKNVQFSFQHPQWKFRYVGGLVTDATRTLASQPIRRAKKSVYQAELPSLSLTTFIWSETNPGPLQLPEKISKR
ncbi:MAG: hypothetical protein ACR2H1_09255 [Limisphaerales bacterium]